MFLFICDNNDVHEHEPHVVTGKVSLDIISLHTTFSPFRITFSKRVQRRSKVKAQGSNESRKNEILLLLHTTKISKWSIHG